MDSRKISSSDKHLIAEQPGMRILVTGLLISFFLGYTAKSLLSPARVSAKIEKAASHIHKDVKVQFGSAQFSLSDGILPRFAVIISDVRMESAQKCWGAPVLEVDELRLPLSLVGLLRGQGPVPEIQVNTLRLNLREDIADCDSPTGSGAEGASTSPAVTAAPAVSLSPNEQSEKYRNDVRKLRIQKLQISSQKYPQYFSEFFGFTAQVKSFEPKVIEVTAKTNLLKDVQVGDYLSHANLFIQYKESPEKSVQAHFFGNWREGHYSVIANYGLDEGLLAVESDLKHIPLSQILAILQKYDLASKELNGRQVWISAKARMVTDVAQIRKAPMEIKDLQLEGDLGDLRVDRIDIASLEPLKYAPIVLDIQKLDVGKLLVLLNRPKKTTVLGELGQFTGRAEIFSDRKMRMAGEHSGLEFVFSNKGQRELQVIEHMVGEVQLQDDDWSFFLKRIEPRGGAFIGDLRMKADRDFKSVEVKARIDEISLAPAVQKLMTTGGEIGLISLDGDVRLKNGELNYLKGLLRVERMNVEGLQFQKTKASIDWLHGEVVLNTQIKSLQVQSSSPGGDVLLGVTEPAWWSDQALRLDNIAGQFHSKNLKTLVWKGFQAQAGKNGKFLTEGSWDERGALKGSVQIRDGKEHKKWWIEGDREKPLFVRDNGKSLRR